MGKSQAQIQKEYRERKKAKEGLAYVQKERERVKRYYVPIPERSRKEQKERREKVNKWVTLHRHRKALKQTCNKTNDTLNEISETSSGTSLTQNEISSPTVSSSTDKAERLFVKIPACDPKHRTRKRISRATAKSRREIEKLKKQNELLTRKYKTASKRYERLQKKMHFPAPKRAAIETKSTPETVISETPIERDINVTPRKRIATELRAEGITPKKVPMVVLKKLVLANAVANEIKHAWQCNGQKGKSVIKRIISGKTIQKYRLKKKLGSLIGIKRTHFKTHISKNCDNLPKIKKRVNARNKLREEVITYLEREDNSRVMPGKADKTKSESGSGHTQTRVLNDNMSNLHMKFISERTSKISLATFCRLRPKYMRLTKYITRNKCLCQKHQNMALLLKSTKAAGATVPLNPDEYGRKSKEFTADEIESEIHDNVRYQQWAKVDLPDGKKRTKIVEKEMSKKDFSKMFLERSAEFFEHIRRVQQQYKAMRDLKQTLPIGHVIIQMDFSENYSCVSAEEVQSAYWNSNSITLHPVVVYFKQTDGELGHKNFMFVSDDSGHNVGAVYTFIKKLVPEILSELEAVEHVHYWTDSPSSQYRNKTAFYLTSAHQELFGMPATWNYFEAGHGKGPCDGLGGTAKRMADLSVKQGKATIQDATDFFHWGQMSQKTVKYIFVSKSECDLSREELSEINKNLVPVYGTLQVHSVIPVCKGKVKTNITSCYCGECLLGQGHGGTTTQILKTASDRSKGVSIKEKCIVTERDPGNLNSSDNINEHELPHQNSEDFKEGEWVSVKVEGDWYIGKILETDPNDRDCKVKFMRKSNCRDNMNITFKWPKPDDELWVKFSDIICGIVEPFAIGRSGRSFGISSDTLDRIQNGL